MKIETLTQHKETILTIADWYYGEWAYLNPDKTKEDAIFSISQRIHMDRIPTALVAFEGDELIGTVCLKNHDMDTREDLTPWLAGLYVKESWRGKGVGAELVRAIEQKALELGDNHLYLYTPKSESFYRRLGWGLMERSEYHGSLVSLMDKHLA
jgi:predicted N-acetyltransferase YhbS